MKKKTCGFCSEPCGNSWCITNKDGDQELTIKDLPDLKKHKRKFISMFGEEKYNKIVSELEEKKS